MSEINKAINSKFAHQKIVIWHDKAQEFTTEFESLSLPENTQKIAVHNNEFGVKRTVFTAPEDQKFLIYRTGEIPQETNNWLLDLELAYGVFTADKVSLALNAHGINSALADRIAPQHPAFFENSELVEKLKKRLKPTDDELIFKAKMTACVLGLSEDQHSMQTILAHLMTSYAQGTDAPEDELTTYNLETFFWDGIRNIYKYPEESENFGALMKWVHQDETINGKDDEYRNIRTDYKAYRNHIETHEDARQLANRVAENTNYLLAHQDDSLKDLLKSTLFEETEQLVLTKLIQVFLADAYTTQDVEKFIDQRAQESRLWYEKYEESYQALLTGAQVLHQISALELGNSDLVTTFKTYINRWYIIDRLYRHYHLAQRKSNQTHGASLFKPLTQKVNDAYTSKYLIPLGNRWSHLIDTTPSWRNTFMPAIRQEDFYAEHVERYLDEAKKIIIISDGLRYEVAQELEQKLAQNTKYNTVLSAMLGVLPSYTQLGMASLLPHKKLSIKSEDAIVSADGISTQSTAQRNKILDPHGGLTVQYQDIIGLSQIEIQERFRNYKFIYIYHNAIDNVGDKRATEEGTFTATNTAISELEALVKKLHKSATRLVITADHGFIYQDESANHISYLSEKAHGDSLGFEDRRFVLGSGLNKTDAFHYFTSEEIGLEGDTEILIPRSIQRLTRKGSGFKYVHGGTSLQEIAVPLLNIRITKNTSTVREVEVGFAEVPAKLTTNLLTVKLVQQTPLNNLQPRRIRAGILHNKVLISDQPEVTFNYTDEALSERQAKLTLELTRAANNKEGTAEILLETYNTSTDTWEYYKKASTEIRRGNTAIDEFN